MNKQRKAKIEKLMNQIYDLKSEIETIRDEEQEYYDNVPENLQGSDRYQQSETAVEYLENAISGLEEIESEFTDIIEN